MTRKQISRRFQIDQRSDFSVRLTAYFISSIVSINVKKAKECSSDENSEFSIGNGVLFEIKRINVLYFKLDSKLINLTQQISAIIFDVSLK